MPEQRVLFDHAAKRDDVLDLQRAIGQDMTKLGPALAEDLANQEPPVAVPWLSAATQQRQAVAVRAAK